MKILFGVSAGISIYKILNVIRSIVKLGHSVKVVMTENAAVLINPLLFKTLCAGEVYVKDFELKEPLAHIRLGDWADLMVIAPATANTIAKIAGGIADNLLTSTILACDKKKIIFPAMNVKMFENPLTQENIEKLRKNHFEVVDPAYGDLACGYKGKGRLPAEDFIVGWIDRDISIPLKGKRFIVTAGGTIEKIDPVRYISNFSSGKMGIEIAKALFKKGAEVLIIHGKLSEKTPPYISSAAVESADDLLKALQNNLPEYDGLFMAAAPADFKVEKVSPSKIKKQDNMGLDLVKNRDILKEIANTVKNKLLIGFALETDNAKENALHKLKEKGLDYIVLNQISKDFNPLGSDTNSVWLLSKSGAEKEMLTRPKREIAEWLVSEIMAGF